MGKGKQKRAVYLSFSKICGLANHLQEPETMVTEERTRRDSIVSKRCKIEKYLKFNRSADPGFSEAPTYPPIQALSVSRSERQSTPRTHMAVFE